MVQSFKVISEFDGSAPISGQIRRFLSGEVLWVDKAAGGDLVAIEVDSRVFVAKRDLFETSCKKINDGAMPFF